MRIVLILLTLYILYRFFFRRVPDHRETYELISCSHCGTFVSKGALLSALGKSFCSEKCRNEQGNEDSTKAS